MPIVAELLDPGDVDLVRVTLPVGPRLQRVGQERTQVGQGHRRVGRVGHRVRLEAGQKEGDQQHCRPATLFGITVPSAGYNGGRDVRCTDQATARLGSSTQS